MIVTIGSDHAGFALKEHLKTFLRSKGYAVDDKGAFKLDKNDDYPDYAAKVARAVQKKGMGILVCGSAEGVCIAANKIKRIRAVAVRSTALAKLARQHNDANVLCLAGGAMKEKTPVGLSKRLAEQLTMTFLTTPFSGEPRHVRRINKIAGLER